MEFLTNLEIFQFFGTVFCSFFCSALFKNDPFPALFLMLFDSWLYDFDTNQKFLKFFKCAKIWSWSSMISFKYSDGFWWNNKFSVQNLRWKSSPFLLIGSPSQETIVSGATMQMNKLDILSFFWLYWINTINSSI